MFGDSCVMRTLASHAVDLTGRYRYGRRACKLFDLNQSSAFVSRLRWMLVSVLFGSNC